MLDDLSELLEQELEACERIRALALEERQAVVAIEPRRVDAINQDLQSLLSHVGRMALQRLRMQESLRQSLNLPDEAVRLTALVPHLPPTHRARLEERADRLRDAYGRIARSVATNQMLMNEYLRTARGFFAAVAGAGETVPTYSKRGTMTGPRDTTVAFEGIA
jgi:hypothetical protein